ncbi:MAG: phosphonate C-P lyase system protein PhnH [Beijerinckiaceae bacterium]
MILAGRHASGFADPVSDSQASFRTLMNSFAHPALARPYRPLAPAWGAMQPGVVTALLSLVDHDTPVWFDELLASDRDVHAQVAFHCGATIVQDPAQAAFAFISDASRIGSLERFARGEPDFPDRSTTVIVQTRRLSTEPYRFHGPGMREPRGFGAEGLSADFAAQWRMNRESFPLGVDLVFITATEVAALPRSLRMLEA